MAFQDQTQDQDQDQDQALVQANSEPSNLVADIDGIPLHVHDLPQVYTKPSAQTLLKALLLLQKSQISFDAKPVESSLSSPKVLIDPAGIPRYLTTIISSPLEWLSEDQQEQVWDAASLRLNERCGRTALPSMTRSFCISDDLTLNLYEPSMTEDNLGLKTWTSSYLLARRLESLSSHLSQDSTQTRVLELGAGTGLVGLAISSTWRHFVSEVLLTDLPDIVPNLKKNIDLNIAKDHGNTYVRSRILDWADISDKPSNDEHAYSIIVAADPIYSTDHPRLLCDTVQRWIQPSTSSRFIIELPLRSGYQKERQDLRQLLESFLEIVVEGEEVGYDDWEGSDGHAIEVHCWWSVWRIKDIQ